MKVAIDISLLSEQGSGTWSYVKYLVEHLAQIDKTNQYYLYGLFLRNYRERMARVEIPGQANFTFKPFHCPSRFSNFLLRTSTPWIKLLQECQIIHMPGYTVLPPVKAKVKVVVTIHGLACLVYPDSYTFGIRREYNRFLDWVKKKADVIISVSEATRKDLIRLAHIPPEKIKVIREASSEEFCLMKDGTIINSVLKRYKIEKPFILSVSVLSPIKNLVNLIHAYQKYLTKNLNSPYRLVIVGKKGWLYDEIFDTVNNLRLKGKVIFVGHVSHNHLVYIYNAADLFVYPSLYEGFGIPVLEAMSCGTPVVTSNISSLPEVAGDAAILVNPQNVDEIAEAIYKALVDVNLKEDMIEKGLRQAAQFSWEKMAKETLSVYNDIV